MANKESIFKVVSNPEILEVKIISGFKKPGGFNVGDKVKVVAFKRIPNSKVKKGSMFTARIISSRQYKKNKYGIISKCSANKVVILNNDGFPSNGKINGMIHSNAREILVNQAQKSNKTLPIIGQVY